MPAAHASGNNHVAPSSVGPDPALPDAGDANRILEEILSRIPRQAGFAARLGTCVDMGDNLALLANRLGWGYAYPVSDQPGPGSIDSWLENHGVPHSLDCLLLGTGNDLQAWESLDSRYKPSVVVASPGLRTMPRDGFEALCALASRKGYRLIRASAPGHLYLLRGDICFLSEPAINPNLANTGFDAPVASHPTPAGTKVPSATTTPPADTGETSPKTKQVDVAGILVEVLAAKNDGNWYLQRRTFEEKASLLYPFIREEGFATFVDVGANYGFVSMLARVASPTMKVIAIEADPRLVKLIESNFQANGLEPPTIIHAIAGDHKAISAEFSLNPTSTLDNRVDVERWEHVSVPMVTIDDVLDRQRPAGRTFFKIDTQGFELRVLKGMEAYLRAQAGWILKMEFAPNWLSSQGTDPMEVLDYLQQRYEFAEFQERIPFGTPHMDALFAAPITSDRHEEFLGYVTSLNKNDLGWVDLIVRPKPVPRILKESLR